MPEASLQILPSKKPVLIDSIFRPAFHSQWLREYPVEAKDFSPEEKDPLVLPSSPQGEYSEGQLDLNEHLLRNPESTFFVRVSGDSMIDVGIHPGDLLVVDRSLRPGNGSIVIAVVMGSLTVKKLLREAGKLYLVPENPHYPCIEITEEMDFMIWGVVTHVIHSL